MGTKWMQTNSGHAYDLDHEPDPWAIDLQDIAFSLAHVNRYNGHAGAYSVAQHSVLAACVAKTWGLPEGVQRAALMHDAHEAYTGDVPSPIKRVLGEPWERFERMHATAVRKRFAIGAALPAIVTTIDLRLLVTERRDLLGGRETRPWLVDVEPLPPEDLGTIVRWTPERARGEFRAAAERLGIS